MTVRAYLSRVSPPESFSMEQRRETIQLERKNVERVLFRPDIDLMVVYDEEGKEEIFDYHRCDVEILKNEPTDGFTDGLKMPF